MWISQDEDGGVDKFHNKPKIDVYCWNDFSGDYESIGTFNKNPNWKKSRINLAKHDYEIIDGILTKKEKTMRHKHADLIHAWADGA